MVALIANCRFNLLNFDQVGENWSKQQIVILESEKKKNVLNLIFIGVFNFCSCRCM
jgi:hypothetical protein